MSKSVKCRHTNVHAYELVLLVDIKYVRRYYLRTITLLIQLLSLNN